MGITAIVMLLQFLFLLVYFEELDRRSDRE